MFTTDFQNTAHKKRDVFRDCQNKCPRERKVEYNKYVDHLTFFNVLITPTMR